MSTEAPGIDRATTSSIKDQSAASRLFEAAITDEQVESLEKEATTQERGMQRRICLVTCSRDSDVLCNLLEESPEAFMETLNMVEAFNTHVQGLVEVSTAALNRMLVVANAAGADV